MKKINKIYLFLFLITGIALLLKCECEKDEEETPLLSTTPMVKITDNSASCGGYISSDGGSAVTERGVCWSTATGPTLAGGLFTSDGADTGTFVSEITGLTPGITYFVRAYATNGDGTSYGEEHDFTTPSTVTDIDGNVYHTMKIGSQTWMAENLRVTHYRNGVPIQLVEIYYDWVALTEGAYCKLTGTLPDIYGYHYNGYAATDARNLAPEGWHVATDNDWKMLEGNADSKYLSGDPVWDNTNERGWDAGGNLKSTTDHWNPPNAGATDKYGFSALPGGYRHWDNGQFLDFDGGAYFCTATAVDDQHVYVRALFYDDQRVNRTSESKQGGGSVRCVKD
jgi:uncharacterized protein (TIGR02145 family)